MAEKFITQSMINGVCKHPELWPNIDTDLRSFILTLPNVDGNTYKIGVKKELNCNAGEKICWKSFHSILLGRLPVI